MPDDPIEVTPAETTTDDTSETPATEATAAKQQPGDPDPWRQKKENC